MASTEAHTAISRGRIRTPLMPRGFTTAKAIIEAVSAQTLTIQTLFLIPMVGMEARIRQTALTIRTVQEIRIRMNRSMWFRHDSKCRLEWRRNPNACG